MRQIKITAVLLSMLLATTVAGLHAQDSDDPSDGDDQPGLMTESMPGIGHLLPVQELLSNDENLATENVPDLGGSIPVDGGLSLLLAAGAAIGVRRLRRRAQAENGRKN
jgi:hypothetical protein